MFLAHQITQIHTDTPEAVQTLERQAHSSLL